jgi:hypothetical protein
MAENHTTDLLSILVAARSELRERWENYRDEFGAQGDEPHDVIHEIADSGVPVYTGDLLELACSDASLATDEPELGPAFDGSPTPVNIIAANVYERVTADLFEEFERIGAEALEALDAIIAQAEADGYSAGVAAGSWIVDGNTSEQTARRLLDGICEGDPAVVDSLPSSPLSGEWADAPTPGSLLGEYELSEDTEDADDVLSAYEDGFGRGVMDEAVRSASAIAGLQECRDCGEGFPYTPEADYCPTCVAEMHPS